MAPLGRCGTCSKQFTPSAYAYKCVVCKINYHPECLQLDSGFAQDSNTFAALRELNCVVCKTCRTNELPAERTDGKRIRDNTAATKADADQIQELMEKVNSLTEQNRIMEVRLLQPSNAKKLAEEYEKKLEAARKETDRFAQMALMGATKDQIDKAALEKLSCYEQEIAKLKEANDRLFSENTQYADKYTSLKRKAATLQAGLPRPNMPGQSSQPSTSSSEPVVITTANMEELVGRHFRQLLKEIREEARESRCQSRPPPIPERRSTLYSNIVAAANPKNQIRRTSVSARRSNSRRSTSRRRSVARQSNPTPSEARTRRQRKSNAQPLKKQQGGRTMAAVLSLAPVTTANRFTILAEPDQAAPNYDPESIVTEIQADRALARVTPIRIIERRSPLSLFVETETEEGATLLKNTVTAKYPSITIKEPRTKGPMLRITGCPLADFTADDIKSQNSWLLDPISIVRTYDAGTGRKAYRNIILAVSLEDQANDIAMGKMLVGFASCRVHEYNDVMQCRRCWRYGHFAHGCTYAPICRICGRGGHADDQCDAPRDSCANCIRHNKQSKEKVTVNHRVTDDRCPTRISRQEYLMDFLVQKHPRQGGRVFIEEPNTTNALDCCNSTFPECSGRLLLSTIFLLQPQCGMRP